MKRAILALFVLACLLCAAHCALADSLSYALLEDGSGYEITACSPSARAVTIPAKYRGLPVVSVAGDAFLSCEQLEEFRTDKDQETFYTEDGVLFTDRPVRTLVRFPNAYPRKYYRAPADTVAVAPWAFAGQLTLNYLHFREGLESFGDHMMDSSRCGAMVYVPDSLKTIGEQLLQNQQGSVSFYGHEYGAFCPYAWENSIPFGLIDDGREPRQQTVKLAEPDLADAENQPVPRKSAQIPGNEIWEDDYFLSVTYDFSEKQSRNGSMELRMDLSRIWKEITPDRNGQVPGNRDPRTGLYGIGFTGEETVLRGYDRDGKPAGTRAVNGDFVFALPDAWSIGVSGGKDTVLTILPYQPVITASAGTLPLDPDQFRCPAEGSSLQYFVIPYGYASTSYDYSSYLNVFGSAMVDAAGNEAENSPHYALKMMRFGDPYLLEQADRIAVNFDHLDVLYKTRSFACMAAGRFNLDREFGVKLSGVLDTVKRVMAGVYYPAERGMNPVTVRVSGEYPFSCKSVITLDELLAVYTDENVLSFAHEMTHAVDQTLGKDLPGAWMEGRAEYISRKVCDTMGIGYWNYEGFDWSVLSGEDRADFAVYYTAYANNETVYSVGYYFFKYLCDTYGEDISVRITENLFDAAAELAPYEERIPNDVFIRCVTDATDPDVFQNFVRDVVEK